MNGTLLEIQLDENWIIYLFMFATYEETEEKVITTQSVHQHVL